MQSLRVTLYEIFGYATPGALALAALFLCIWGIYYPSTPIRLSTPTYNVVTLGAFLFCCYLTGHFIQAISNVMERAEARQKLQESCNDLAESAKQILYSKFGVGTEVTRFRDIVSLSQAVISQNGSSEEHEMYVYREGFYRGSSISLIAISLSCLIRALHHTFVTISGSTIVLPTSLVIALAIMSSFGAALFYTRFHRFGEYRVRYTLSAIAVRTTSTDTKQTDRDK